MGELLSKYLSASPAGDHVQGEPQSLRAGGRLRERHGVPSEQRHGGLQPDIPTGRIVTRLYIVKV